MKPISHLSSSIERLCFGAQVPPHQAPAFSVSQNLAETVLRAVDTHNIQFQLFVHMPTMQQPQGRFPHLVKHINNTGDMAKAIDKLIAKKNPALVAVTRQEITKRLVRLLENEAGQPQMISDGIGFDPAFEQKLESALLPTFSPLGTSHFKAIHDEITAHLKSQPLKTAGMQLSLYGGRLKLEKP